MITLRRLTAAVALVCALAVQARAANPTANAGADQTIAYGALPALVTLSGSGTDPDGGTITAYQWTTVDVPPGSAATLSSATAQNPTFTADVVGTYRFCLKVTDSGAETNGTDFLAQPTAACTNVMATTANLALVKPAKGQRNTWDIVNAWATALDALKGDFDAFVALIASTSAGAEGAAEVGTDTKTNLDNATDVETALEYLDSILTTVGPYLPIAGGTMEGDILLDADNAYDVGSGTNALAQLWSRLVDSTGALALGTTTATSVALGRAAVTLTIVGSAVGITGTTTITGDTTWNTDNLWSLGSATIAARGIYTRLVSSSDILTIRAATGAAGATGKTTYVIGGAGGAGTAVLQGGDGGVARIDGGVGGVDNGAGAGAEGSVCIACTTGTSITLGSGGTELDLQGYFVTDLLLNADDTYNVGSASAAAQVVYSRGFTNGSGTAAAFYGTVGAAESDGSDALLYAGNGGAGTGIAVSGDGGDVVIDAGEPGADNGGGQGSVGTIRIGNTSASAVTIGNAGTAAVTLQGLGVDLPAAWALGGVVVNATAANLNTLVGGTSSIADSLHRHAVPVTIVEGGRGATTLATATPAENESATPIFWAHPNLTTNTVRCTGICATSGADNAVCSLRWKDESAAEIVTIPIPDASCGDGGTALANGTRFDVQFATSSLTGGGDTFGSFHYVTDAEGGDCFFAGVYCWAY